jgi:integrase
MANYTVALLASLFSWAGRRGLAPEGLNPARAIDRFEEDARERFLSSDEFAKLGAALREAETLGIPYDVDESRPTAKHAPKPENRLVIVAPDAVAAIRLLMFTGCRLREILNLGWQDVDFERGILLLRDSKTGRKTVVLGTAALEVLSRLPRVGEHVFPGADARKPRADLKRPWAVIKRRAGLTGLRIHDLRHSFASVGAGAGLGLPIIGRLLGHAQPISTARYAHLADDPLRRGAEAITRKIAAAMGEDEKVAAIAAANSPSLRSNVVS